MGIRCAPQGSAGTTHRSTINEMERMIRDAGFEPRRRRQDYSMVEATAIAAA